MPRRARSIEGGLVYHILNRSNARMTLFEKDEDYAAFDRVLEEAHEREPLRVLAYCVLSNHWHRVVWPKRGAHKQVSEFLRWLTRELDALRRCVRRGQPYGTAAWCQQTIERLGLGWTIRPRGRPRKQTQGPKTTPVPFSCPDVCETALQRDSLDAHDAICAVHESEWRAEPDCQGETNTRAPASRRGSRLSGAIRDGLYHPHTHVNMTSAASKCPCGTWRSGKAPVKTGRE